MTAAVAGCALFAAAGGAGVSFAFFANPDASTGNSATAGTLELTGISPAANNVLPPAPGKVVRPGGPDATGIQVVGNGGDVPGDLSVRVTQTDTLGSGNDLTAVLRLRIEECTSGAGTTCTDPVQKHDGLLASATSPIALGTAAPSTSKRIRVRVYWPRDQANTALYDDKLAFRLSWSLRTTA